MLTDPLQLFDVFSPPVFAAVCRGFGRLAIDRCQTSFSLASSLAPVVCIVLGDYFNWVAALSMTKPYTFVTAHNSHRLLLLARRGEHLLFDLLVSFMFTSNLNCHPSMKWT